MQKKLTLRLDKQLIDYAKGYAEEHGTSVSRVVANYFAALSQSETTRLQALEDAPEERKAFVEDLPPITRSLIGAFAAEGKPMPESKEDVCTEYYDHLEEKHR